MSRNAYTTCDEPGCDRSPANGHVLYRANPKGERGIFMCREHEQATWQQPSIVRVLDGWSEPNLGGFPVTSPTDQRPLCADCWCDCYPSYCHHYGIRQVDGRWLCISHAALAGAP